MIDQISALPDDLLCHILSFVPTKFAVCTSILSTRWRCLYTLVSSIDIDIALGGCLHVMQPQFLNYIDRALLFPNRSSIQRFGLKWHHYIDPLQINTWIGALVSGNIQELELCRYSDHEERPLDMLIPTSLFSSETLMVLKLVIGVVKNDLGLKIPAEASLPNLKVLHIVKTTILGNQVENLLSTCPVLDDLVLDNFFTYGHEPYKLTLSSATLRRLTIRFWPRGRGAEIVINSAALEYLKFDVLNINSRILLAKHSLVEVVIHGYSPEPIANRHEHDVLKEINNIQSLQIIDHALQGICDCNLDLPLFNRLMYLKLQDPVFLLDARCLEHLLAQCVVLETLVFELPRCSEFWTRDRERIEYSLQQSRLVGLLRHLKVIKVQLMHIQHDEGEALKKIIKFFLNNAKILEELRIQVSQRRRISEIMEELVAMPRVSKNCRVVLNELRK